jgi:hypothetical protein
VTKGKRRRERNAPKLVPNTRSLTVQERHDSTVRSHLSLDPHSTILLRQPPFRPKLVNVLSINRLVPVRRIDADLDVLTFLDGDVGESFGGIESGLDGDGEGDEVVRAGDARDVGDGSFETEDLALSRKRS